VILDFCHKTDVPRRIVTALYPQELQDFLRLKTMCEWECCRLDCKEATCSIGGKQPSSSGITA